MTTAVAARRSLRVAIELQPNYWFELTCKADPDAALDLIAEPVNVVRIKAEDLRDAQKQRAAIRAELVESGRNPDSVTVLLDIEALIAPHAAAARAELAQLDAALPEPRQQKSITYIGTPSGLAGLIADIQAAEVADGVTLRPLSQPGTLDLIQAEVLELLGNRGLVAA